ncbi:MAG: ROK family protein, partial [Bryocella sp.]
FHLPVAVHNDAQAAVLAELRFGIGRELNDFVAITIGTGVGGGIVSGGKLLCGQHGFAGSLGHQTIRFDGRPCNCGRLGCLEAYVSAAALVREYQDQQVDLHQETTGDAISAMQIGQLALAGDAGALAAYSHLAKYLAEGIANMFNILDPQAILISGGLVEGHTHFIAEVEREVTALLHFGDIRKPRIQLSAAGQYAGVQGAAAAIFDLIDE